MERKNNPGNSVRLVSREQLGEFMATQQGHDWNSDGIISPSENTPVRHLEVVDGGRSDQYSQHYEDVGYGQYDEYDQYGEYDDGPDDIDQFSGDVRRDVDDKHNRFVRRAAMVALVTLTAISATFGVARRIEDGKIYSAKPEVGMEYAMDDSGLDQTLHNASANDDSLRKVVEFDIRKAREDAIELNKDVLDADGDGHLDATRANTKINVPTYPELNSNS